MKTVLAHNHGHKNVGDDAMAVNVFRKLEAIDPRVMTISTYAPPAGQHTGRDVLSLTGIINDYKSPLRKVFLVACARFRLRWIYALFVRIYCAWAVTASRIHKRPVLGLLVGRRMRALIRVLDDADLYVRSGSGSLNDIWFWSSMWPQLTEARIASAMGARVAFTGQGLGPLTGEYRLRGLKALVDTVDYMSFRDASESRQLVERVVGPAGHCVTVGDDAFDYAGDVTRRVSSILATCQRGDAPLIVCQFRATDYEKAIVDGFWVVLQAQLEQVVERHPEARILFVSFSTGRVNDLVPARRLATGRLAGAVTIVEDNLTPGEARALISAATLTIGQSYHFGVFSLAEDVPFVGLYTNEYYRAKLGGLLEWYGLQHLALSTQALGSLAARVDEVLERQPAIVAGLASVNGGILERLAKQWVKIRTLADVA